jgi:LacI family transcriptional regulator
MVTSHDVARLAGVSQTTVSRVLNGSDKVRGGTRDRVLAAAERLNYVPSAAAQSMRTRRTGAIGVIASDITNPFFPALLDSLSRETHRHGFEMILWNHDDDSAAASVIESVSRGLVDGVCVASAAAGITDVEMLRRIRVPLVFANRRIEGIAVDCVTSDNAGAARQAAGYLAGAGRRRIAAIFGPRNISTGPERESAFVERLAEEGISIPERWKRRGPSSFETGYAAVQEILDAGDMPDTIYCNSDLIAFGAINAMRKRGVRVPEDVWIMGVDGLPMSAWEVFDLTTVGQPIEHMAERSVALLVERIHGSHAEPVNESLPTRLVIRGSTAHHPLG